MTIPYFRSIIPGYIDPKLTTPSFLSTKAPVNWITLDSTQWVGLTATQWNNL